MRDEPIPLRDSLANVGRELGVAEPDVHARVVAICGGRLSARSSPNTPVCGRCVTACAP